MLRKYVASRGRYALAKTPFRCKIKRKLMTKPHNDYCNWGLKYPKDISSCFCCAQNRYSIAFEALKALANGENPTYFDDHNKDK